MAEDKTGSFGKDKVVTDMMRDFKLSADAEADNRTRALYVLDFIRPGADQWSPAQVTSRGTRATYSFNQLPKFGRQVINDMWQNMPQIKYIPKGDTNKDKAELLEDKVREVQASGSAQTAYKLAIASQINMGWAYFAFGTEYDNRENFDQNIVIRQIPNPFQVYDDPTTKEQDRSDRRHLIEIEDVPRTEFNKSNDMDYTSQELTSIGDSYPSWASMGKDLVRVGHYWRIEYDKDQLWRHKKTGKVTKEDPKDKKNYEVRDLKKPKVMYYKCTALDKLEEREWEGSYIPYCFVEGNKNIIDGKVYYTGLYEDMIPTQILFNYATNTAIELAESAPISPFMGDSRAFKGFEDYYDNANAKNYSYLPYNAVDDQGNPISPPQRTQNGADLSSAVQLIQMAEQNFYGTSGIYPASLGQQSNEKSGKAIIARQKEGDVSTSNYSDTFGRALLYGGIIFEDLSKKILDGARTIQVMSEDKKTRPVKINQKFTDDKTGKAMNFDLTEGDYNVQVSTGPSYSTKREEGREAQIQLFQAAPQAMLPALPDIIRNMDWPGADKTADAVERGLPPELRDPERTNEQMKGIPPQVQAQMQQAQQIIQQLGGQLQQVQQELQSKEAENQAKMADVQVKMADIQQKGQSEQMKAQLEKQKLELDAEKIQLDRDKLELDAAKIQLDFHKAQATSMQQPVEGDEDMKFSKETLAQMMQDLENQEVTKAEQDQAMLQSQAAQEQAKINKEAEDRARSDALLQGLTGIQAMLGQLTLSITTPKTAIKTATGEWVVAPVVS